MRHISVFGVAILLAMVGWVSAIVAQPQGGLAILRVDLRGMDDREPTPSAAVMDSQSIKTTEAGGPKGYDAGKKNRRPQAACGR